MERRGVRASSHTEDRLDTLPSLRGHVTGLVTGLLFVLWRHWYLNTSSPLLPPLELPHSIMNIEDSHLGLQALLDRSITPTSTPRPLPPLDLDIEDHLFSIDFGAGSSTHFSTYAPSTSAHKRKRPECDPVPQPRPSEIRALEKSLDGAYADLLDLTRVARQVKIQRRIAGKGSVVEKMCDDITKAARVRQAEALAAFHTALSSLISSKIDIPGCGICYTTYVEVRALKPQFCGHVLCEDCYQKLAKPECPRCKASLGEPERIYI
jgi:hypothetical protein